MEEVSQRYHSLLLEDLIVLVVLLIRHCSVELVASVLYHLLETVEHEHTVVHLSCLQVLLDQCLNHGEAHVPLVRRLVSSHDVEYSEGLLLEFVYVHD